MAIAIKIKPVKVTAKTKQEVIDRIRGFNRNNWSSGHDFFSNNGSFLHKHDRSNRDRGLARLYSLEKHNHKVKVEKHVNPSNGKVTVIRTLIRESGWVGHYYEIPVDMIDTRFTRQHTRTFTLKLK